MNTYLKYKIEKTRRIAIPGFLYFLEELKP